MARRYRKRASDEDEATRDSGFSDFVNVENRREEPFPEEFAEGPYGAPRERQAFAASEAPLEAVPPPARPARPLRRPPAGNPRKASPPGRTAPPSGE